MANPLPIRPGVVPEVDLDRELLDYFMLKVRQFRELAGSSPESVAVVLLGERGENLYTICHSWSPKEQRSRLETCAVAATLLQQRAVNNED